MKKIQLWAGKILTIAIALGLTLAIITNPQPSLTAEMRSDWGYGEATSSQWGELSPKFAACSQGKDQSPVDINNLNNIKVENSARIEFNYQPSDVEVINNGKTIKVDYQPGNILSINDEVYELLQFHFHTPSEHTIENKSFAMALHLVHQNKAGKLAVVGVMINSGAENPVITSIWNAIPKGEQAESKNRINIDAASLLPKDKTFISYYGSLTTPPCSEQVSWNVFLEPIELSSEQIETFASIYPYNARAIQPLNGRSLKLHI
jgi:carbonic anhydrase